MARSFLTPSDFLNAQKLNLDRETLLALEDCSPCREIDDAIAAFWAPRPELKAAMDKLSPIQALAVLIKLIPQAEARYAQVPIPLSVLWEGLTDIPLWVRDHQEKTGTPGLTEGAWCARFFRLELFRLGRLQFEPWTLTEDVCVGSRCFAAGAPCLRVHIPAGSPLEPDAVANSLLQVEPFFRTYLRTSFHVLTCDSWLLSPQLAQLLPSDSRIMQFRSRFALYGTDPRRQAEERVFGMLLDDPKGYPEDTALQQRMKAFLCAGNPVLMGKGILLSEKIGHSLP